MTATNSPSLAAHRRAARRSSSSAATSPRRRSGPRGREVDEADVVDARRHLRQGRRGRHHRLHARRGVRRRRLRPTCSPSAWCRRSCAGATRASATWCAPTASSPTRCMALGTDEQKKQWLRPLTGTDAADDRARHHRARRRLGRRVDHHHGHPRATAATGSAGRRRGSPTPAPPSSTWSSPRPTRTQRSEGVTAFLLEQGHARADLRRADEEDGPARDRLPRALPRRRVRPRGEPARRRGTGLLRPDAHLRHLADRARRGRRRRGAGRLRVRARLRQAPGSSSASRSSSTRPWRSGWPTWRPGSRPPGCWSITPPLDRRGRATPRRWPRWPS